MTETKDIFKNFLEWHLEGEDDLQGKIAYSGLNHIFLSLYDNLKLQSSEVDKLVYYIVFAYTNISHFIVTYQDPQTNRKNIMKELKIEINRFWKTVLKMQDTEVSQAVSRYLHWQHDTHWNIIMVNHNWYVRNMMFVEEPIDKYKKVFLETKEEDGSTTGEYTNEPISQKEIGEIELQKSKLIDSCMDKERDTRDLITQYKKRYQKIDAQVDEDIGQQFTEIDTGTAENLLDLYNRNTK